MLGRPERIRFISPLNHTDAIAIEVVLEAEVQYLFRVIKSIEIKMIKCRPHTRCAIGLPRRTNLAWILLEQCKGRAIDDFRNTQTLCKPLCKGRLARSQLPIEENKLAPLQQRS